MRAFKPSCARDHPSRAHDDLANAVARRRVFVLHRRRPVRPGNPKPPKARGCELHIAPERKDIGLVENCYRCGRYYHPAFGRHIREALEGYCPHCGHEGVAERLGLIYHPGGELIVGPRTNSAEKKERIP